VSSEGSFGGLVLGQTFLGYVAPDAENWVFGASASASLSLIGYTAFVTVAFFGAALLGLPRLIRYTIRSRFDVLIKFHPSRYALFLCFSMVALASLLNVNIVFGAL